MTGARLETPCKIREESAGRHGSIEKIAVDYFGAGDPAYYLGKDTVEGWYSSKGDPREENIEWLAVSAEFLQNSVQPTDSTITRKPGEDYGWLKELRPAPRRTRQHSPAGLPCRHLHLHISLVVNPIWNP